MNVPFGHGMEPPPVPGIDKCSAPGLRLPKLAPTAPAPPPPAAAADAFLALDVACAAATISLIFVSTTNPP
ncbi:hypothetical protein NDA11_001204 [Ustilago hordei]|nr:hypothetical protein NDA10_007913 [Ustilago hordei]KAJ1586230.1 hypothetical protein NDA12_006084 [Ustilago hordei]KAJ1589461.1 hypothetical protein NDA15_005576 [Ustilago hordei]KAJ1590611.1 hypothetical protein NDA11_001204 [Ustilago hordei]KAJ1600635.1 hypothetical protein NDA14_002197 [Ustilago hordei]